MENKIFVSASLDGRDIPAGVLWFYSRNGRESASFEYEREWLARPDHFALEPALFPGDGRFHTREGLALFGSLGDSAPDRWGRLLLRRAEIRRAKETGKRPRTLTEADYLLGVNDEARQGALRFRETPQGPFQAPPQKDAIPPLITLPKLLAASERFLADSENAEDLRLLLAPGSSLGGARPKASVYDKDGSLSIAKFPRKDDEFNAILWEALALTLAKRAGIQVPLWRLERFLDKPVLILQRFDRRASGIRVPFLSAMSMLDARDNEQHSYLEIAYALSQYGAAPKEDLTELWRRMVFTILISNTDNHLRNHGFLHDGSRGWRLAPAYDLNPTPLEMKPHVLSTAIDFNTNEASLEAALQVIGEFRLKKDEAEAILKHVRDATAGWRAAAKSLGINRQETERMASAFV